MELLILNTKLESDSIIDAYKSLIWTDRYEIFQPLSPARSC